MERKMVVYFREKKEPNFVYIFISLFLGGVESEPWGKMLV